MKLTTWTDDARLAAETLIGRVGETVTPTLRLGVTGLARSGKTIFLTSLVHNLMHGGRLPLFDVYAQGRLKSARLRPQPDDHVPRFAYEQHLKALVEERIWPDSTSQLSELRLVIEYESASFLQRQLGRGRLVLDVVDYPGEWLLDLPLLSKDYATWSAESLAEARKPHREAAAEPWLAAVGQVDPAADAMETEAQRLSNEFTGFLKSSRSIAGAPVSLPPGRFLMPGDLAGSPMLTFAPLPPLEDAPKRSLWRMMERRFEAYKAHVVRPFFLEHFARLDRQIVLVDLLASLNGGPAAIAELEAVMADILACFRSGRQNILTRLIDRRIDKVLFAATKADHLHHQDHDRLEAILRLLVAQALEGAESRGAKVSAMAMAAVRATREGTVSQAGARLPAIVGVPLDGETVDGKRFDGATEIGLFPGDLPEDPKRALANETWQGGDLAYLRFRPPALERTSEGLTLSLPHIRLDRALQFLMGDRLV